MPDFTVTITDEQNLALESFYTTASGGIIDGVYGTCHRCCSEIIRRSVLSELDPNKLTNSGICVEIARLDTLSGIPTYDERY